MRSFIINALALGTSVLAIPSPLGRRDLPQVGVPAVPLPAVAVPAVPAPLDGPAKIAVDFAKGTVSSTKDGIPAAPGVPSVVRDLATGTDDVFAIINAILTSENDLSLSRRDDSDVTFWHDHGIINVNILHNLEDLIELGLPTYNGLSGRDIPSVSKPELPPVSLPNLPAHEHDHEHAGDLSHVDFAPEVEAANGKRRVARHGDLKDLPAEIPTVLAAAIPKVAGILKQLIATVHVEAEVSVDAVILLVTELICILNELFATIHAIASNPTGAIWNLAGQVLAIKQIACLIAILVKTVVVVLYIIITTVTTVQAGILLPLLKDVLIILFRILAVIFNLSGDIKLAVLALLVDIKELFVCFGIDSGVLSQFGIAL